MTIKRMRHIFTGLALVGMVNAAMAADASNDANNQPPMAPDAFSPPTNQLWLANVVMNNVAYSNIILTINSYTLVRIGSSGPSTLSGLDTFDPSSNQLWLNSVFYGNALYNDVVIKLNAFTIDRTVASEAIPTLGVCMASSFTAANYNAITVGMTMQQVTQLMGCAPTAGPTDANTYSMYYWKSMTNYDSIQVWFDPSGSYVQSSAGWGVKSAVADFCPADGSCYN